MDEISRGDAFSDDQLEDLFSAFDELSASDALKASTLEFIAAAPTAGAVGANGASQAADAAQPADGPKVNAMRGKKPRVKGRTLRATAIAASLALVVTGGVAYATPTSMVIITQGGSSIELGVNFFGTSVSAMSGDDIGRAAIEAGNLVHMPYEDALVHATQALEDAGAGGELAVQVESADEGQRARLASQGQAFIAGQADSGSQRDDAPLQGERPSGDSQGGKASPSFGQPRDARVVDGAAEPAYSGNSGWTVSYGTDDSRTPTAGQTGTGGSDTTSPVGQTAWGTYADADEGEGGGGDWGSAFLRSPDEPTEPGLDLNELPAGAIDDFRSNLHWDDPQGDYWHGSWGGQSDPDPNQQG